MGAFIDLLGKRFGRLTVIERMPNNKRHQAVWKCLCDCGKEVIVASGHLRSGHSQSCGCLAHERAADYHRTHDMKGTKLFRVYHTMKGRCCNPTDHKYPSYGGRGIKICSEWLSNPKSFFEWALANGYKEGLSIDRINNEGDYCPENCRWVDSYTQANNKRNNHIYEYYGNKLTIAEWAKLLDLSYSAIKSRIKRGSFERLFPNNKKKELLNELY